MGRTVCDELETLVNFLGVSGLLVRPRRIIHSFEATSCWIARQFLFVREMSTSCSEQRTSLADSAGFYLSFRTTLDTLRPDVRH
jgi:hypothetical protein